MTGQQQQNPTRPATTAWTQPDAGVRLVGFVKAGPGGAMTDEVGVITGELTLATEDDGAGRATLTVQYTGAWEWYTLTGSPVPLPEAGLAALHEEALALIRAGGGAEAPDPVSGTRPEG
ncbi:hypothetical protein [Streptomyces sp. NPDC017949]|uniref:hypothetical protein n=1 Tax=Streptomyces sp. NPDC017949 TaxID=3365020 RepID=UPI00379543CC